MKQMLKKKSCQVVDGGLHQASLARYVWMDGCGYLLAIYQQEITQNRGAEQRCRPLRRLILLFFTVNPQWSHQHWYDRRVVVKFPALQCTWMNGRWSCFLDCVELNLNMYIFTLLCWIFLANVSSGAHLRQISQHCHSIHFHSHNQSPIFLDFSFKYIFIGYYFKGLFAIHLTKAHQRAGERKKN